MTPTVHTIAYGSGREIGVSVYRDMGGDRGVRIAQRDTHGGLAAIKLTPEQAGELVAALIDSGACVPKATPAEAPAVTAAGLSFGSVIATSSKVWIRETSDPGWWDWACTDGEAYTELGIDTELSHGATVLRVGDGTTGGGS